MKAPAREQDDNMTSRRGVVVVVVVGIVATDGSLDSVFVPSSFSSTWIKLDPVHWLHQVPIR